MGESSSASLRKGHFVVLRSKHATASLAGFILLPFETSKLIDPQMPQLSRAAFEDIAAGRAGVKPADWMSKLSADTILQAAEDAYKMATSFALELMTVLNLGLLDIIKDGGTGRRGRGHQQTASRAQMLLQR